MDFSTLKAFVLLSQNGSFSQTAKLLHMTQPAVSHQIKGLEEEVNQTLFARKGKTAHLTYAGQLFLPYAQRILTLLAEGKNIMAELGSEGGRLSIGAGTATIIFRLPDILQNFKRNSPAVDLIIKAASSKEIIELVLNGSLDFGLVTTPAPSGKLTSIPLYQDEILLVAPSLWDPPGTPLRLEDLEDEPLILFPRDSGFRDFLELIFRTHNFHPKVALELDNIEGIKQMVRIGMGLSFLPKIAVADELSSRARAADLLSHSLEGLEGLYRTTYLISLPERIWTRAMKRFALLINDHFNLENKENSR